MSGFSRHVGYRGAATVAAAAVIASVAGVLTAGVASAAPAHANAAAAAQPAALAAPPTHVYPTTIPGLPIRTLPSTTSKTVQTLGATGTKVTVDCYALGQTIRGDQVWYHTVAPKSGFVAGFYVASGHDPATGVPVCTTYYRPRD